MSKNLSYTSKKNTVHRLAFIRMRKRNRADGAILTLTGYFNYGNVVQRYALQRFLQSKGYNYISYVHDHRGSKSDYRISKSVYLKAPLRFVKRFFNYQRPYWYIPKVSEIYPEMYKSAKIIDFVNRNIWIKPFDPDDNYKSYIVGSDQVWRNWWGDHKILGYYFLDFLKERKVKRIAYAVSFGKNKINEVMAPSDIEYIKPYIKKFDKISVREKSGVNIIKQTWGISGAATAVDPTLLLDASNYSKLINDSEAKYEKIQPIFPYIIDETPMIDGFIRKVQDSRKQAVTKIQAHGGVENDVLPSVEVWLKGFRDAELVVTNSFHGMMLSVINNRDFIIIGKEAGGLSRINDFLAEYNIEGRFVGESEVTKFDITRMKQIDWDVVNKKLEIARERSKSWILGSL